MKLQVYWFPEMPFTWDSPNTQHVVNQVLEKLKAEILAKRGIKAIGDDTEWFLTCYSVRHTKKAENYTEYEIWGREVIEIDSGEITDERILAIGKTPFDCLKQLVTEDMIA